MATESLIIELDARTGTLEASLNNANQRLDQLESNTRRADSSLSRFTTRAKKTAETVLDFSAAAVAAGTALAAVIINAAQSSRELSILSGQAKLSTKDFESLAFAAKQYGINGEQIADISKDISDKLGEFSKVGTGAFQDFADVAGLTKEEAMALAASFETMSSDQVIGEMVSRMESAGASANQMTFALESMGNDLSRLTPLFADNSKELETLRARYNDAAGALSLTSGEAKDLQQAATSFDLMTNSLSNGVNVIASQLAPQLNEFFNSIIKEVPNATQTVINFINSFRSPDEIESIKALNEQILDSQVKISELRQEQMRWTDAGHDSEIIQASLAIRMQQSNAEIKAQEERITGLIEKKKELEAQELADAERLEAGKISTGSVVGGAGGTGDEIQAIADRFKSEEELLSEKLARELEIIGDNNELKLELEREFQENLSAIQLAAAEEADAQGAELRDLFEENKEAETDAAKKAADEKLKKEVGLANKSIQLGQLVFGESKEFAAASALVNTYEGVTKALAKQDYAGAALTAAMGAAQVANIYSTQKGASGTASVGGTGAQSSSAATTAEETSDLSVTASDVSGEQQQFVIRFEGSGDDITEAIANNMKVMQLSGSLS